MEIRFVCPRTNEAVTEPACEKTYEYEACMGCTSQQDAARQALYEALQKRYGGRMRITLEKHEVRMAVREGLTILADPGDWREDVYVGIECGKYGSTHTHPVDALQWVEDFLAGRIFILLDEDDLCSAMLYMAQGPCWDDWHEWKWAADASGTYPAPEYAEAKGFIRK